MSRCQHDDCDREGIAAWNGCVFCDEHMRERLRTTADSKLLARIAELEAALLEYRHARDWADIGAADATAAKLLPVDIGQSAPER